MTAPPAMSFDMEIGWLIASGAMVFLLGVGLGFVLWRLFGLSLTHRVALELAALREQLKHRDERLADLSRTIAQQKAQADCASAEASQQQRQLGEVRAIRSRMESELVVCEAELAATEAENRRLFAESTRLSTELEAERRLAAERLLESERGKEQVRGELERLAGRMLEEKGQVMLQQSQQNLEALLTPLTARIKEFEQKVEKTYDQDNRDRASLLEHLSQLQSAQARLHQDAQGLARALTGESKAQGDWGELTLERLLDMAGLTHGIDYELQVCGRDEEGASKRPDAVLRLPHNRAVVVDSKCSMKAFVEATRADTPEAREVALAAHLASIRRHLQQLGSKGYQALLKQRTLDSVLLFIPSEAAFHAALSQDLTLHDEAIRQRIVLCSPTTLLPALKLIAQIWRSEKQSANAQQIARDAGRLLDKLKGFVDALDGVGAALMTAQNHFDDARKKLSTGRGNVLKQAQALARLGAQAKPETLEQLELEAGEDGEALEAGPEVVECLLPVQ